METTPGKHGEWPRRRERCVPVAGNAARGRCIVSRRHAKCAGTMIYLFSGAHLEQRYKKAQSRPGFGLLRASVLTSNREEKQLVL